MEVRQAIFMIVCLYLFKDIEIQRVYPLEFYEKSKQLRHLSQLKSQTLSNFAVNSLVRMAINGIMK